MRNRLTGFLRQTTNAIHASKLRDRRAEREREAAGKGKPKPPKPKPSTVVVEGVTIEYSPTPDGDPDPGEVVWAWVPYEDDPAQGKDRPVVVIGRRAGTYVGVPLTSKHHDHEPQVAVGTGPWDSKSRPSYAKLDRMIDLDPRKVRREGSALARGRFDELIGAVRRLHPGEPRSFWVR